LQLYGPGVSESKTKSEFLALGRSREPPVAARFGRINDETKLARMVRYPPKAAPLHAVAIIRVNDATTFLKDENEAAIRHAAIQLQQILSMRLSPRLTHLLSPGLR
jgi:hypothetical protein